MCEDCDKLISDFNLPDTPMSADELRASVQLLGLTTKQLAKACECSTGTAKRYQTGSRRIPRDIAIRVRVAVLELEPHGHA